MTHVSWAVGQMGQSRADPVQIITGDTMEFLVGTYTQSVPGQQNSGQGIYAVALNGQTGTFEQPKLVQKHENPSWLCVSPDAPIVFCVRESFRPNDAALSAYGVNDGGHFFHIATHPLQGEAPCHLDYDPFHKRIASAQYGSGDVVICNFGVDGFFNPVTIPGQGTGPNADRQEGPHAHFVSFSDKGNVIHSVDLGADQILSHNLDVQGNVTRTSRLATPPGSGPRHMALSADARQAWVLCELDETILHLTRAGTGWRIAHIHPAFSSGATMNGAASAIWLSSCEKFFYVAGRGQSVISAFTTSGKSIGETPSGGAFPRDFTITHDGKWVIAANQLGNTLACLPRDPKTGRLSAASDRCNIGSPVVVVQTR